jgi:hypothetical protein
MNVPTRMMLGRTAVTLLLFAPVAACAKPADQAAASYRETSAKAAGLTAATFVSRHEKKLMAGDTDGNGKLSRAEFVANAKSGKGDPAKRFTKLDKNGDASIDKSEIDVMLNRRFKRLDINGDGILSPSEREAVRNRKTQNAGDASEP